MPGSTRPAADALTALRAATQAMHNRLDSGLPIAQTETTPEDYRQHVAIIGSWLGEIDRLDIAVADWPIGWQEAQQGRQRRILQDLGKTLAPPATLDPTGLPAGPLSSAFAWGVAYVVEGSQLGGTMLYRRLHERLAPQTMQYLMGDGLSGRWARFTSALRTAVASPAQIDDACAGAVWAFGSLGARFQHFGALT